MIDDANTPPTIGTMWSTRDENERYRVIDIATNGLIMCQSIREGNVRRLPLSEFFDEFKRY